MRLTALWIGGSLLLASCDARDSSGIENTAPAEAAPDQPADAPAEEADAAASGQAATPASEPISPCLVQDGRRIPENRLQAIGTEPFWGARIEGRCVTYSTPEDIEGTRVWTTFGGSAERGSWSGSLDDQRFVLSTRPEPGCSDGMSDRVYPIAVTLTVRGERRTGCADRPWTGEAARPRSP